MSRVALFLFAFFMTAAQAGRTPAQLGVDAPLQGLRCEAHVTSTLDRDGVSRDWKRQNDLIDGSRVFRSFGSPTGTVRELRISPTGGVSLLRITARTTLQISWDESCIPQIAADAHGADEKAMAQAFTDESLAKLLESGKAGVIYAWSPRMPYSVEGISIVRKAAEAAGLRFVPVLDPAVPAREAEAALKKIGASGLGGQKLESNELLQRNVLIHFPAVVVYTQGRLSRSVLFGLKDEAGYRGFIREQLSPTPAASSPKGEAQ